MKKLFYLTFFCFVSATTMAQVVTTSPVFPRADQPITITVDVTGTSLEGFAWNNTTNPVWIWTWIEEGCSSNCDAPTNVNPATAAQSAAKAARISVNPDVYVITFTPTTFFNKPVSELKTIGLKLKSVNWNDNKQTDNNRYIEFTEGFEASFTQPTSFPIFKNQGEQISITGNTSVAADLELKINDVTVTSASNATSISYTHTITEASGASTVVLVADNGSEVIEESFQYIVRSATITQTRPAGIVDGINYSGDATKVTLSLLAPGKSSVYVLGDFSDWNIQTQYQMKKDGEHFWLELTGLTPGQEYGYKYVVDETLQIADPFADKILDPADQNIPAATYPGLKPYPAKALTDKDYFNRVAVFQTAQAEYTWQVTNFEMPAKEDLVIYELHIRDFFADGQRNYQNLIDTLSYFKRLGINAIELMPIMEFAGNDSWGYNPTFMFAPDKYYGTKNKLKEFIDKCHEEGIAVILDIVLNHQDTPHPYILMDFNFTSFKPNPTNPWFNVNATHPFSVFFDMNHESAYTKAYVDTVNHYWLNEYRVDGFRYDLSKGFTQTNTGGDVAAWSAKDDSRIALLKRMADKIRAYAPDALLILEHLGDNSEEKILADYGFLLWGNLNHAFSQNAMGFSADSDISWSSYKARNWNDPNLVAYMESHDEERMMYRNLQFGNTLGGYSVKTLTTALDRIKAAATLYFSIPGPKMIWQFGELGYDISIDFNGRVGAKPVKWEYYTNASRYALFEHFSDLIALKKTHKVFETTDFTLQGGSTLQKQVTLKNSPYTTTPASAEQMNVQVIVNFDVATKSVPVNFPHTGKWYSYFDSQEINVTSATHSLSMPAGAYKLFTDFNLNASPITGIDDETAIGVELFPNPVNDKLHIRVPQRRIDNASLWTAHGVKLSMKRLAADTFDVAHVPAGIYIVKVETPTGVEIIRIVKH